MNPSPPLLPRPATTTIRPRSAIASATSATARPALRIRRNRGCRPQLQPDPPSSSPKPSGFPCVIRLFVCASSRGNVIGEKSKYQSIFCAIAYFIDFHSDCIRRTKRQDGI
jgi:hypothetical protein